MKTLENTNEARQKLIGISNTLQGAKDKGEISTINEGIIQIYASQGHTTLKTLKKWSEEGKRVKRGVKAFYLWGKRTEKVINENGKEKTIFFCPLVALFSENQVYTPFNNK